MNEQLWDRKRKLCEEVGDFKKIFFSSTLWFCIFPCSNMGRYLLQWIYSLDRISQVLETLKILEPGLTVRIDSLLPHILFTFITNIFSVFKSEHFIFKVRKARLLQELHLPLLMLAQTHLSQVIGVGFWCDFVRCTTQLCRTKRSRNIKQDS